MSEQEFIKKMMEAVLDTEEEFSFSTMLEDIDGWDSLSFVSFIAMAREAGYINVNRDAVNKARTVNDLFNLVR